MSKVAAMQPWLIAVACVRSLCRLIPVANACPCTFHVQFSLDAYNDLYLLSIRNSPKHDILQERIKSLNDYHT